MNVEFWSFSFLLVFTLKLLNVIEKINIIVHLIKDKAISITIGYANIMKIEIKFTCQIKNYFEN